ncbi:MAG TPA: DMT family transporter [Methylomirabilota bacterium]|nr:DMT family transporter [Methylomirabilota bacterium]
MNRISARPMAAVLLVAASALWGAATVLNKYLLGALSPVPLLVIQLSASAAFLWCAVLFTRPRRIDRGALLPLVLLGVLNPGISYTLGLMGLDRISASVSTLLWAAEPMLIMGLAAIVLREPITARILGAVAVGAAGVLLVSWSGGDGGQPKTDMIGIALLFGAVFCCAVYTVYSRKLGASVDPLLMVAVQQTAGLAWALGLLGASTAFGAVDAGSRLGLGDPAMTIAVAALAGLMYYALAYWLYLTALRSVPAVVAGASFNLIPVFGIGLAMVFLGESLTPIQWTGAALILLAVSDLMRSHRAAAPA